MVNKFKEAESFWRSLGVDSPQMVSYYLLFSHVCIFNCIESFFISFVVNYLFQYFGSATGMFRIFPARHSRECGQYDPRERPWYKGAVPLTISNTVKPRHVVMLLDISLSMGDPMSPKSNQTKLGYMKNM